MRKPSPYYSDNLRFACSTRPSISELCRSIGINRQQFNRYINAGAHPSAHNRLRIASIFGLDPADFDLPPPAFRHKFENGVEPEPERGRGPLSTAFPGDLQALRPYLGFYQTWHVSLSWPGRIVCSCSHMREKNGQILSGSLERIEDRSSGIRQRSRYVGLAAFRRQRIFITELSRGEEPTFGQTILAPFALHQRHYLRGVTMGLSWRNDNLPYAARTIWLYRGKETDKRALLAGCGIVEPTSATLPSVVASFLTEVEPVTLRL